MSGLIYKMRNFFKNTAGNFSVIFAVSTSVIFLSAGAAVDYTNQHTKASRLQDLLDSSVLAGAVEPASNEAKVEKAEEYFAALVEQEGGDLASSTANFEISGNDTLVGSAQASIPMVLIGFMIEGPLQAGAYSEALFSSQEEASDACVYVLANTNQALLINSGADVNAPNCEFHVNSQQNPAFIMNSGSSLDVKNLCVAGNRYIRNGGYISNLETDCDVKDDPYSGTLAEPVVSSTCTTQGAYNPGTHNLSPGVHCAPTFNGSSTINFAPGLHIIKGRMIINGGSTINAQGVTFYFPDTDSEIRANGGLSMSATAPATGPYAGILMFEKTSDNNNNNQKRQYIFNGSNGEELDGLIYLPNRDVVYNSTTNISGNTMTLVVNTMIINSANWSFSGSGSSSGAGPTSVRLKK